MLRSPRKIHALHATNGNFAAAAPTPANSTSRASISFNGRAALEDPPSALEQFYLFPMRFTISQRMERALMRASRVFWQALAQAHTASQGHILHPGSVARSCASRLGFPGACNRSWPRLNRSCCASIDPGRAKPTQCLAFVTRMCLFPLSCLRMNPGCAPNLIILYRATFGSFRRLP